MAVVRDRRGLKERHRQSGALLSIGLIQYGAFTNKLAKAARIFGAAHAAMAYFSAEAGEFTGGRFTEAIAIDAKLWIQGAINDEKLRDARVPEWRAWVALSEKYAEWKKGVGLPTEHKFFKGHMAKAVSVFRTRVHKNGRLHQVGIPPNAGKVPRYARYKIPLLAVGSVDISAYAATNEFGRGPLEIEYWRKLKPGGSADRWMARQSKKIQTNDPIRYKTLVSTKLPEIPARPLFGPAINSFISARFSQVWGDAVREYYYRQFTANGGNLYLGASKKSGGSFDDTSGDFGDDSGDDSGGSSVSGGSGNSFGGTGGFAGHADSSWQDSGPEPSYSHTDSARTGFVQGVHGPERVLTTENVPESILDAEEVRQIASGMLKSSKKLTKAADLIKDAFTDGSNINLEVLIGLLHDTLKESETPQKDIDAIINGLLKKLGKS